MRNRSFRARAIYQSNRYFNILLSVFNLFAVLIGMLVLLALFPELTKPENFPFVAIAIIAYGLLKGLLDTGQDEW